MKLEVLRYSSGKKETLGLLFDVTDGRKFLCHTLEDEYRPDKVHSETRIPAGTYEITLRKEGGFHAKYEKKFPFHEGMLWVRNVPGFEYILIHIGNTDKDTAGCLLVGDAVNANRTIALSAVAYERVYKHVLTAFKKNEAVEITYVDFDTIA